MRRAAKRVMLAPLLLLLQCAAVSGKNLVASVAGGLKAQGDTPIVAIACCGAGRATPSVVTSAVGAGTGAVSLVADAHTPLALLDAGADADADADSTSAVASCDVLALEVRFTDLVERTPHGLAQLGPLLQRSVKLRDLRPQPKLLLLTVTDYDKSEASEAAVTAFVAAELKAIVAGLALPEGADLSVADLLQLHCVFLPSASAAPDAYDAALARLREALLGTDDSPSLFDGRLSSPASAVVSCMGQAAERAPGVSLAAPPADVHAAYQCGLLAEAAAREFQKGASALRKAADAGLLSDFGERASTLVSEAINRFDADSSDFQGAAPVSAARAALAEQLQRVLYGPYRKQLAALQRQTLARFRAKVNALKPSVDIVEQCDALTKEAIAAFDASARSLLPDGVRWVPTYERTSVLESMQDTARLHVQTLQVQGLYLDKSSHRIPVDLSAHWLLMSPFGRDSRFDPMGPSDEPAYKPQASEMKLRATDGYKPGSKLTDPKQLDPKNMVFSDKMMQ